MMTNMRITYIYLFFQANVDMKFVSKYIYNQNMCANVYNNLQGRPNIRNTMLCAVSYDIVSTGCVVNITMNNLNLQLLNFPF